MSENVYNNEYLILCIRVYCYLTILSLPPVKCAIDNRDDMYYFMLINITTRFHEIFHSLQYFISKQLVSLGHSLPGFTLSH